MKEVVKALAINPNTVLKAYKELEHQGLVAARPGIGTFVIRTLGDHSLAAHGPLERHPHALAGPRSGPVAIRPVKAQFHECTVTLSATYHTVLTYQPPSRFWPFQWAEMGIFLAGALALCALTYWWLHRRYA